MGRRPKQTFLQRKYTDGQQAHEKMLDITNYSVQFSRSVVSDSLWPHESQHTRPPCPSPSPGVHSNSHPSSQWCHPAISSSVIPFSSCPQSLPASESFPMSQLFAWGSQSTGVSALASFLPKKSQGWSPSELTNFSMLHITSPWLIYFITPSLKFSIPFTHFPSLASLTATTLFSASMSLFLLWYIFLFVLFFRFRI